MFGREVELTKFKTELVVIIIIQCSISIVMKRCNFNPKNTVNSRCRISFYLNFNAVRTCLLYPGDVQNPFADIACICRCCFAECNLCSQKYIRFTISGMLSVIIHLCIVVVLRLCFPRIIFQCRVYSCRHIPGGSGLSAKTNTVFINVPKSPYSHTESYLKPSAALHICSGIWSTVTGISKRCIVRAYIIHNRSCVCCPGFIKLCPEYRLVFCSITVFFRPHMVTSCIINRVRYYTILIISSTLSLICCKTYDVIIAQGNRTGIPRIKIRIVIKNYIISGHQSAVTEFNIITDVSSVCSNITFFIVMNRQICNSLIEVIVTAIVYSLSFDCIVNNTAHTVCG